MHKSHPLQSTVPSLQLTKFFFNVLPDCKVCLFHHKQEPWYPFYSEQVHQCHREYVNTTTVSMATVVLVPLELKYLYTLQLCPPCDFSFYLP